MQKKIAILLSVVLMLIAILVLLPSCKDNSDVVAEVNSATITQNDVDAQKEYRNTLSQKKSELKEIIKQAADANVVISESELEEKSDEEIIDELIKQKVMELECEKLGFKITEDDVLKFIDDTKNTINNNDATKQYFNDYAKLLGKKDAEEYIQSDIFKNTAKYILCSERLYSNFVEQSNKSDTQAINDEYEEYLSQLIDAYNVKKH